MSFHGFDLTVTHSRQCWRIGLVGLLLACAMTVNASVVIIPRSIPKTTKKKVNLGTVPTAAFGVANAALPATRLKLISLCIPGTNDTTGEYRVKFSPMPHHEDQFFMTRTDAHGIDAYKASNRVYVSLVWLDQTGHHQVIKPGQSFIFHNKPGEKFKCDESMEHSNTLLGIYIDRAKTAGPRAGEYRGLYSYEIEPPA